MVFLIFGDIFAVWVFPFLLPLLCYPVLHAYLVLLGLVPWRGGELDLSFATILMFGTYDVSSRIALATPHLRETPRALLRYIGRSIRLMMMVELICAGIHAGLMGGLSLMSGTHPLLWMLHATVICAFLGYLIWASAASRTFLEMPWTEAEASSEPVRGSDLETSADIALKAWLDE